LRRLDRSWRRSYRKKRLGLGGIVLLYRRRLLDLGRNFTINDLGLWRIHDLDSDIHKNL